MALFLLTHTITILCATLIGTVVHTRVLLLFCHPYTSTLSFTIRHFYVEFIPVILVHVFLTLISIPFIFFIHLYLFHVAFYSMSSSKKNMKKLEQQLSQINYLNNCINKEKSIIFNWCVRRRRERL